MSIVTSRLIANFLMFLCCFFVSRTATACEENYSYTINPSHIKIDATCSSALEAEAACHAFAAANNHAPSYCHSSGDATSSFWWAGWLWENGPSGPYTRAYLGTFRWNSASMPVHEENLGSPPCPDSCFGDPINAGTGNRFQTHLEYAGEGSFPLRLEWTYNSLGTSNFVPDSALTFGKYRSHSYSSRVAYFPNATTPLAYVTRPNGKALRFKEISGVWTPDSGQAIRLTAISTAGALSGWEYEDTNGVRETFDLAGKLLSLQDRSGQTQSVSYDSSGRIISVKDSNDRLLSFEYDGSTPNVARLRTPDGRLIQITYLNSYLKKVTYQDLSSIEYLYDESGLVLNPGNGGLLTGIVDESASRFSTVSYANGRAVTSSLGTSVDSYTATYTLASSGAYAAAQASIALPSGATRTVAFGVVNGMVLPTSSSVACSGCITATKSFSYDTNGRVDTVTENGFIVDKGLRRYWSVAI